MIFKIYSTKAFNAVSMENVFYLTLKWLMWRKKKNSYTKWPTVFLKCSHSFNLFANLAAYIGHSSKCHKYFSVMLYCDLLAFMQFHKFGLPMCFECIRTHNVKWKVAATILVRKEKNVHNLCTLVSWIATESVKLRIRI